MLLSENWNFSNFNYVLNINMEKITIITLGESGVGKTSLLNRFKTGKFKETTRSTFVDNFLTTITVENIKTNAMIWDTAGQERYNSLIKRYYAMADGVLLIYDVHDALTFSKLSKWLSDLRLENEAAEIIIVGNKNEDPSTKLVSSMDVMNFAEKENLQHLEASAKTGQNVDLVFKTLIKNILIVKGMLPHFQEQKNTSDDKLDSKNSIKVNSEKKETEISFSYYGKSELSENVASADTIAEETIEEVKRPGRCFPCRWN